MKINMNDTVKVILTEVGAKHYNEKQVYPFNTLHNLNLKERFAGEIMETQLWCLMRHFGDIIYIGLDIPFETDIEVVGK